MKLNRPNQAFQIVAHRGLPQDYPENTLPGYQAALKLNIDILEIDVHLTKDEKLVVIHDDTINRTSNGKGKVKDFTYEELLNYDFSADHTNQFKNSKIPLFEEVLTLIEGSSKKLLIEIKKPSQYPNIERKLIDAITASQVPSSQIIIQSFDQQCIESISNMTQEFELGVLISKKKYWYHLPDFEAISHYAQYANPNYELVSEKFMSKAHEEGLKVYPYTVNEIQDANHLIQLGIDGVISDVPNDIFEL